MKGAYYNEINPQAAECLRGLIKRGLIADGEVDERSILDVSAADISGFRQCHFFAGIGGWSLALRLAGWPDERPVWTGSPPCQPFSIARNNHPGKKGQEDERHLMPFFAGLIGQQRPAVIFGEQVANAIGWGWLDEAFGLLEGSDYACGAAVMPGNAFGAIHERKRVFWVGHTSGEGWPRSDEEGGPKPDGAKFPVYGDPLAGARNALATSDAILLPCDGLSLAVDRGNAHLWGNAIIPEVAAEFIQAFCEATGC